ncbi:AMP-binding protein [Blastomonas sp.]|uniref:AMP-binding protein n=1 Tax=Blastomonas sp. TaxID=1909299 RepID=UPI00260250E2|nr:AMP-binding protein [Blastomonas sp.]MDM7955757.1 AMP-binding protein [Blastomonas sp.]
MTDTSLTAALVASFDHVADRILIAQGDRTLSGRQLRLAMDDVAARLMKLGVAPGDRVAVQAPKSIDLVLLYLGCLRLGAVYLPLNDAYRPDEIGYFLGDAEPALFICAPDAAAGLQQSGCLPNALCLHTLGLDGEGSWHAVEPSLAGLPPGPTSPDTLAAIVYTSGTTGRSKGAMISQGNLLANARDLAAVWRISAEDTLLHALPLYHIHGLFVALHPLLLAGARIDLMPSFDPRLVLEQLGGATIFMGVPTYYTRLLSMPELNRDTTQHVRLFVSGSAPLTPVTFAAFGERTGRSILERYGMTECGIICSNPLDGQRLPGAVGQPLPGYSVRLADKAETGVLEVKGPSLFSGYWRMPEKTREEFRDDGYFITGDIATIDADGVVRIVGRDKDMIISGGLNIYPVEIEALIEAMDEVGDVAVVGVPHADFGEAVLAVVCLKPGRVLEATGIVDRLRGQLASYKLPKAVAFAPSLPRNAMGKVQKAELRRVHAERFVPCV